MARSGLTGQDRLVLTGHWSPEDECRELKALAREHAGLLHEVRLGGLGCELRTHAPLAIRRNTCGFAGDRWVIELDDGRILRLKLYWPRRVSTAALCSVVWVEHEGWRVVVRSTAGEKILLRAFRASLCG